MTGVVFILLVLIIAALLKSHLSWEGVRRILSRVFPYDEPSPVLVRFLYLRMSIYEAFYEVATQRGNIESFFKLVGESIKKTMDADAYSVLFTPQDGNWYFVAWDEKYDKRDLDSVAPLMREMSGAKMVHDSGEVKEMSRTSKFKEWRYVQELADVKNIGGETKAWIGIPVKAGGKVVAVISMDWFEPRRYRRWAVDMARRISEDVSTVAEGMRDIIEMMTRSDYDPLFGVPGRRAFEEDFKEMAGKGERVGIVVIRIEGIERIREIYGQSIRNEILKSIAKRLKSVFAPKIRIYSLSQNTLAFLVPNPSQTSLITFQRKVLGEFLRVFNVRKSGKNVFAKLNAKVGFSVFPDDGEDLSSLLDLAMKRGISH